MPFDNPPQASIPKEGQSYAVAVSDQRSHDRDRGLPPPRRPSSPRRREEPPRRPRNFWAAPKYLNIVIAAALVTGLIVKAEIEKKGRDSEQERTLATAFDGAQANFMMLTAGVVFKRSEAQTPTRNLVNAVTREPGPRL